MKNYLYLISTICILLISGCAQNNIRPDSNINEEWFEAPYEDLKSSVSRNEATLFVEQFFDLIAQVIFDPDYRKDDLTFIKKEIKSEIDNSLILTKLDLLKSLNKKINQISFSHLGAFNPEKFIKILQMSGMKKDQKAQSVVSAYLKNQVGIIEISSFLVPSITLAQLKAAKNKVKSAKYLIYDMRNNGGGSVSSISYVIETILGPDQTFQFSRSRKGLSLDRPVIKNGYFHDESNLGSTADIEFENQNHYVEWKTSKDAIKDTRPIIIIVNSKCGSSCDIFTAAIKESRSAKILGTKTAGEVLGAIAYKMKWKGYIALMPVAQIISPNGILYEGVGVVPDYEIKSCEDPKDKNCINEAIKHFKK